VVSPDERTLLDTIDGRTVKRFNGTSQTLHTRGAALVAVNPTLREEIMDRLMDPNLAVLILLARSAAHLYGVQHTGDDYSWGAGDAAGAAALFLAESAAGALYVHWR